MKKIGIIGSGGVAQALAAGFLKYGYQVMVGSRNESKLAEWKKGAGAKAETGKFSDAAKFGDIIVLAVKGLEAKNALKLAGFENLKDKTVMDVTNPLADAPPANGVLKFFTSHDKSLMEELQETIPQANFVKAFNSVGSHLMVNPPYETKPTMFFCGNNDNAKNDIAHIIDQFGYEAADFGKAESARAIEPLCMLWCIPGFMKNEWTNAFKLLKLK